MSWTITLVCWKHWHRFVRAFCCAHEENYPASAVLERMQAGDSMELAQLQILVHRIHGSAVTFDFAAISGSAGRVEQLAEVLLGTSAASVIEAHDLRHLVECGRTLVQEIGAATTKGAEVLASTQDESAMDALTG